MTSLHNKSQASEPTALIAAAVFAAVLLRLVWVEADHFSYDYRNYLSYMRSIGELDWIAAQEVLEFTFPYVLVSTGLFEIGFVGVVAGLLRWVDPATAYALLAGVSIGLRTFAMRRLGLSWMWIVPAQIYAITLFEANALRAGLALTLVMLGMLGVMRGRWLLGLLLLALAPSMHLQALLFALPWLGLHLVRGGWMQKPVVTCLLMLFAVVLTLVILQLAPAVNSMKLDEYAEQSSAATGLTLFSLLAGLWLCVLLVETLGAEPKDRVAATIPLTLLLVSWTVLVFGGALAAVADRVWQFAWVSALPLLRLNPGVKWSRLCLALCLGVALINVLLRYPLSNFFWPLVPYERIVPLWFAP